ncbi:hypothetical protein FRB93_002436 [Tulasnella sp. JGI-2019a]|nr:hypothetical protein FRB93_002436 [Tulasnella sp. JGI-2019a]
MGDATVKLDQPLRSQAQVEWRSFSGAPSDNVLLFTQAVNRFAFANQRHLDPVWMATYAYGCLSGEALDWFEDLDLQDKHDWGRLRPAMIKKFRTKSVPTQEPPPLPTRSRIKVVKSNGTTMGYVLPPKASNDSNFMNDVNGALVLDIPNAPSTQQATSRLKMLLPSQVVNSLEFFAVTDCSGYHSILPCAEGWTDAKGSGVWYITKTDGTEELRSEWIDKSGSE